jgi:peptidoglycan hydrolase-like protein with peptidoglycan-binding domain
VTRRTVIATGIVAVGLASAALIIGRSGVLGQTAGNAAGLDHPPATRLVPVVRTTLTATQPVSGHVGASQTWSVGEPIGSTTSDVAAARAAVAAATDRLALVRRELAGARRTRALVIAQDNTVVRASRGSARLQADRARQLDQVAQDTAVGQAEADVATAARDLDTARRELAGKSATESLGGGTVTAIPSAGDVIDRGQTLFAVDGRPTVLFLGPTPFFRALRAGETGPDVAELQANLHELGYGGGGGTGKDGLFDALTTAAVRRWQAALGTEQTGVVRLGEVAVLPTSVRISTVYLVLGATVPTGAPLLGVSSTDQVVTIRVDPALAPSLHPGDAIRFEAADGSPVPGTIRSVGAPAIPTQQQPGDGPPNALSTPVVAVTNDPSALANLDGAVLHADITTGTADNVLAVPVNALVVLADGGFGVEVDSGGSTHYVRVQPGLYDRTMVEVRADGLNAGDQVVVPAS